MSRRFRPSHLARRPQPLDQRPGSGIERRLRAGDLAAGRTAGRAWHETPGAGAP
ncbi:MAG: hypothetical protein ACRDL7_14585 [Gaiellaceae bacterium]